MPDKTRESAVDTIEQAPEEITPDGEPTAEMIRDMSAILQETAPMTADETSDMESGISNGSRRFMRRGGVLLVGAAAALGVGVLTAMVLRNRSHGDEAEEE